MVSYLQKGGSLAVSGIFLTRGPVKIARRSNGLGPPSGAEWGENGRLLALSTKRGKSFCAHEIDFLCAISPRNWLHYSTPYCIMQLKNFCWVKKFVIKQTSDIWNCKPSPCGKVNREFEKNITIEWKQVEKPFRRCKLLTKNRGWTAKKRKFCQIRFEKRFSLCYDTCGP